MLSGLLVLLLCAVAPIVQAGGAQAGGARAGDDVAPPAGLMWNRTGLPAVFPLQVKTPPGQDYVLTLIDAGTGDAALAAYVRGGAFFKVLVPPGVFRLRFATGDRWRGEDSLFGRGAKTRVFELPTPLTFETRGLGVKAGHVVTLPEQKPGQGAQARLKDQLVCQSFRLEFPAPIPSAERQDETGTVLERPRPARDALRFFAVPGYEVRSRYCG